MKVLNNITLYAGMDSQNTMTIQGNQEKKNGKSLYAGGLNSEFFTNDLQQKKKEAQERAMKVIADAWAGDREIDEDLQARAAHIDELQAENKASQGRINEINQIQEDLMTVYGVTEDSVEQQELELLRQKRDLYCKGSGMTQEEFFLAVSAEADGLTEYQQRQLELDAEKEIYQDIIDENEKVILEENAIISATKRERLKHSPMVTAQKHAEAILEAASEELIGMTMENVKEHIDKEQEQREEKAEKIEEEKKEKEAFIEKQKEKRDSQEELLEEMPMEELLEWNRTKVDIQKEVKNILSEMKLVTEDVKGARVDESL